MTVILRHDGWEAEVVPFIGGGLAGLRYGGIDILRPSTVDSLVARDPLGLASFPLVPYPGRIRGGQFVFDGRAVALPPNFPPNPYPLHGCGWIAEWLIAEAKANACLLRHVHAAAPSWPWSYEAELSYHLAESSLTVRLTVGNHSATSMPVGLGQHPYFLRRPDCLLRAEVKTILWPGEDLVCDEVGPVPENWKMAAGHRVGSVSLDHGFGGWSGRAEIGGGDRPFTVRMTAPGDARFLQVYAPDGADFLCVEPMTCMPDAVNRDGAESGLIELAPGATASLSMLISVVPD
jgi:aldose 1-epimerase